MMKEIFPIDTFKVLETPFYYYDIDLLKKTLKTVKEETARYGYIQHYAVKANANKRILEIIASAGFGADCVSGNEIKTAISAGFPGSKIVFAGVGKTDKEIKTALDYNIYCFNVESLPEMVAINEIAKNKGKKANIALRINPNIDAYTHEYITTGLKENKFGFNIPAIPSVLEKLKNLEHVVLTGIHFHIGSQIRSMEVFKRLCEKINEIQEYFIHQGIRLKDINVGGGLGIDYNNPNLNLIPDFSKYFAVFNDNLIIKDGQTVHFELGRAIVGQCGSLISRVTYVKEGESKKFIILDAGMTDLIRPALYKAYHKVENLTSTLPETKYDIVGPVCESSDTFAKDYTLSETQRGDLIALRSAGAYSEAMVSQYNCRDIPKSYYSDNF